MDSFETADPAIVAAWVAGWALSRGLPPPVAVAGGWRVDVHRAEQRVRFVLPRLDQAFIRHLTATENIPGTFIKVCAAAHDVAPLLRDGWSLQDPRHMMTVALKRDEVPSLARGYAAELRRDGAVVIAMVRDEAGAIAASGQVALCPHYATVDQVGTDSSHRRKGLGKVVMASLEQEAYAAGSRTGLLVATPDGLALYRTLGWAVHSPYSSVQYA